VPLTCAEMLFRAVRAEMLSSLRSNTSLRSIAAQTRMSSTDAEQQQPAETPKRFGFPAKPSKLSKGLPREDARRQRAEAQAQVPHCAVYNLPKSMGPNDVELFVRNMIGDDAPHLKKGPSTAFPFVSNPP
jgi:hypothetical protein